MSAAPGTLFLLPVSLGDTPWPHFLPTQARQIGCGLKHFVVENARTARAELKRIEHPTPLRDLDIAELPDPAPREVLDTLLAPARRGEDIGLMSEAGCPAVADPGARVVARAHELGIPVRPLVGPSSILLALMASGLNGQSFAFNGYLPVAEAERNTRIRQLEEESRRAQRTQIFIETPYRNDKLLDALLTQCKPATRLCIARDLTTADERIITRAIKDWRAGDRPELNKRPALFLLLAD